MDCSNLRYVGGHMHNQFTNTKFARLDTKISKSIRGPIGHSLRMESRTVLILNAGKMHFKLRKKAEMQLGCPSFEPIVRGIKCFDANWDLGIEEGRKEGRKKPIFSNLCLLDRPKEKR